MSIIEYGGKIIGNVGRILIDTSAVMSPGFRWFVSRNKALFIENGKKMIVPKVVYTELARHLQSGDSNKVRNVMNALDTIVNNEELFVVENVPLTDEEIETAFADPLLLAELTLFKTQCKQLLISNDHKLTSDAFKLNQQESCRGRKVFVCYISPCGELQCCDCVRSETKPNIVCTPTVTPIAPVQPAVAETCKSSSEYQSIAEECESEVWHIDWGSFGLGVAGAGAVGILGYGAYKLFKALADRRYVLEVVR